MPQQITGVQVSVSGSTVNVQLPDGSGFQQDIGFFFGPQPFDTKQIISNMRLAKLIGGYANLLSKEYLAGINVSAAGVRGKDADYFVTQMLQNPDGSYQIGFGPSAGVVQQTISAQALDLTADTADNSVVLDNLVVFLRIGGYTSFTAQAIAAVAAAKWWF